MSGSPVAAPGRRSNPLGYLLTTTTTNCATTVVTAFTGLVAA
ncbi:hypothetical protein ACFYO7_17665 [Nocardia salmonicida]